MIATLWLQLTDIYGSRFVNPYGEKDSGVWYQALNDLNEDDLQFGIDAMMRDMRFETWPPNCTQFRHLCIKQTRTDALPSVHQAFNEAVANLLFSDARRWSHPAVKFTVKYLGIEKITFGRKDKAFAEFSACYQRVCKRIADGHQVPEVSDEEVKNTPKQTKAPPRLTQLLKGDKS